MDQETEVRQLLDPQLLTALGMEKAVRANGGKPVNIQIYFLQGIFGEIGDKMQCNGIGEAVIHPPEGGTFLKLVGCSYLYKGDPQQSKTFGLEQGKSMISNIPMLLIGKSMIYVSAIGLRFLLQRKKFIEDVNFYLEEIRWKTLRHHAVPDFHMNAYSREIRRAVDVAVKKLLKIDPEYDLYNNTIPSQIVGNWKLALAGAITKATAFAVQIMELDGAYKFPTQDILGEKDTENAKRSGVRETMRLFNLMLERQTNLTVIPGISDRTEGVPRKFRFLKYVIGALFLFSSFSRKFAQEFLVELDEKKVALDDADWYFCLRRNTHNYRGVPLPERLEELKRIDNERGHQYLNVEFQQKVAAAPTAQ